MNGLSQKGNISDDDFMIHVLNIFPKESDVILDGLENHLMLSIDDALTIEVIQEKWNHRNLRIKTRQRKNKKDLGSTQ